MRRGFEGVRGSNSQQQKRLDDENESGGALSQGGNESKNEKAHNSEILFKDARGRKRAIEQGVKR